MPETVQYDVQTNFRLTEQAMQSLRQTAAAGRQAAVGMQQTQAVAGTLNAAKQTLARTTDTVNARIAGLTRSFVFQAGALVGATASIRGLWNATVGANEEFEKTQKALGGVIMAFQKVPGATPVQAFQAAEVHAEKLLRRFDDVEEDLAVPMQALAAAARQLAQPVLEAGRPLEDLAAVTEKASLAARIMGVDVQTLAFSISNMVEMGYVPRRGLMGRFFGDLREQLRKTTDEGKRMKLVEGVLDRLAPAGRAAIPPIEIMKAKIQGVMDVVRDAGKPAFQAVVGYLTEWAKWVKENQQRIGELARTIIDKVVVHVRALIGLVKELAHHWEVIAVFWIGKKLLGGLESVLAKVQAIAGASGTVGPALAGGAVGAAGAGRGTTIGGALGAVAVGVGVAQIGVLLGGIYAENRAQTELQRAQDLGLRIDEATLAEQKKAAEALDRGFNRMNALMEQLAAAQEGTPGLLNVTVEKTEGALQQQSQNMVDFYNRLSREQQKSVRERMLAHGLIQVTPEELEKRRLERALERERGKVNVKIDKVVVQQDFRDQDPDRVYVRFLEDLSGVATAPLSSPVYGPLGAEGLS